MKEDAHKVRVQKKVEHPAAEATRLATQPDEAEDGHNGSVAGGQWGGDAGRDPLNVETAANSIDLELLQDPKMLGIVEAICRWAINRYGEPKMYSWVDLRQAALIKFMEWLSEEKRQGNPVKVFTAMAINTLIDEHRRQKAQRRGGGTVLSLDDADSPLFVKDSRETPEKIINSLLVKEHRDALPDEDRELFDAVTLGESLSDFARRRGVSRQTVSVQFNQLLDKVRRLSLPRKDQSHWGRRV